jgi:hypothetical protein
MKNECLVQVLISLFGRPDIFSSDARLRGTGKALADGNRFGEWLVRQQYSFYRLALS